MIPYLSSCLDRHCPLADCTGGCPFPVVRCTGGLLDFLDFLDFLEFLETSEVAGPGPNPREIDISFGADGPLACARPDPTIGWTDVLPCVFVCVWGRYPPAAALLVRRLVVPVLNKLLQLPLPTLAGAWRVL